MALNHGPFPRKKNKKLQIKPAFKWKHPAEYCVFGTMQSDVKWLRIGRGRPYSRAHFACARQPRFARSNDRPAKGFQSASSAAPRSISPGRRLQMNGELSEDRSGSGLRTLGLPEDGTPELPRRWEITRHDHNPKKLPSATNLDCEVCRKRGSSLQKKSVTRFEEK